MRDSPTTPQRGGAMLPAARLWTRTSGRGLTYLAGRLEGVRVVAMPKRDGDEGDHSDVLMFAEAPPRDGEGSR
jgi:hypothetical protein